MIAPGTTFAGPLRIPLSQIVDPSTRRVSVRWLLQYWRELVHPEYAQHDADPIRLSPRADGRYTIEDGRHRFYATLLAQRCDILALIQYPPQSMQQQPSFSAESFSAESSAA